MNILGKYRIAYPKYGMSHVKNLVPHDVYAPIVKHRNELINEIALFDRKADPNGFVKLQKELDKEVKLVKSELEKHFGVEEFFTDKSPLWLSQETNGVMFLSVWQGGEIEVKLERIKE